MERPPGRQIAFALLVLGASLATIVPRLEREPFEPDEAMWIHVSQGAWERFRTGAWEDPAWRSVEGGWGSPNPPVAKYLIGAGLAAQGEAWEWRPSARPPVEVLRAARRVSAALGVLGCVALYWIGLRSAGAVAGLLAGVALAFSPLWIETSRRVMTDIHGASLALLAVAAVLPALGRAAAGRTGGALPWVVSAGVLAGLAAGAKLNAGSAVVTIALLLVLTPLRRNDGSRGVGAAVVLPLVFGAVAAGTFVASNPYLHPDPAGRLEEMLGYWRRMCLERAARSIEHGDRLAFHPEEWGLRFLVARFVGPPRVEGIVFLLPLALAALARGLRRSADGLRYAAWSAWVVACAMVVGGPNQVLQSPFVWAGSLAALLAWIAGEPARPRPPRARAIAVLVPLWAAVAAYFVWRMTYWAYDRYYLPLLPATCLAAGWGWTALLARVRATGPRAAWLLPATAIVACAGAVLAALPGVDRALVRAWSDAPLPSRVLHVAAAVLALAGLLLPRGGGAGRQPRTGGPTAPSRGSAPRSLSSPLGE